MSDLAPWPLAGLSIPPEFRSDMRYAPAETPAAVPDDGVGADEPLVLAWQDGFAAGVAEAQAKAQADADATNAARELLSLALGKLDREMAETLRQRLHDTVAVLCESALAPLALDSNALGRRIERAVALLQRAGDERTIRINPADIALISEQCRAEWVFLPDPLLPRGALRIETADGGVEDGPAQWRAAISEALQS